ncbi:hypothetical protein V1523DRAFT_49423 [Lipomyces doorenjongii]
MGVHDIDIGRYFLDVKSGLKNPKKQVNRVTAVGQQAVYGELAKYGDCDNGWGLVEFANGKVLTTHLGRTLTNGFEGMTRVCGTKGHSVINGNSTINRVEVRDQYGVRTATTPDAFVLYDKSFLNDLAEFADAVSTISHSHALQMMPTRQPRLPQLCSTRSAKVCLSTLTTKACLSWRKRWPTVIDLWWRQFVWVNWSFVLLICIYYHCCLQRAQPATLKQT